ncbi:MAG TPA: hypothetical protein VER14_03450 [Phototrophicaceae bacterium]|nr:hypothetical protein [Phototrophicaceae bacterium]
MAFVATSNFQNITKKRKNKTHTHRLKKPLKSIEHYIVVAEPIAKITKEILNHQTTTLLSVNANVIRIWF